MADIVVEAQQPGQHPEPQQPNPQGPPARPKVKSYLHKFYDRSCSVKDPALYEEEDEMRRLLNSSGRRPKPRGCHLRPIVWKAMLWIGVNCLIFGALGLAIAFFLPHEPELIEVRGTQGFMRNQSNAEWNRSASILKYVALGIFGFGALVTAAGLVLPSLVWRLFDEDDGATGGQQTDSCCSSGATVSKAAAAARRQRQKPGLRGTTGATASTTVVAAAAPTVTATAAAATATTAETPALSSLVDERPVQPPRGAEGHVSHGQVK